MAKDTFIKLRCTEEFKAQIEVLASKENRTVSNYIENLLIQQIKENKSMKNVTNMNGTEIWYEQAVELMDDDIREELHNKLAPCSDQVFFTEYEKVHEEKFGEEWELSKENPTW